MYMFWKSVCDINSSIFFEVFLVVVGSNICKLYKNCRVNLNVRTLTFWGDLWSVGGIICYLHFGFGQSVPRAVIS